MHAFMAGVSSSRATGRGAGPTWRAPGAVGVYHFRSDLNRSRQEEEEEEEDFSALEVRAETLLYCTVRPALTVGAE